MPLELEKDEGPATTLVFLGLELDLEALLVCLPKVFLQLKSLLLVEREKGKKKDRAILFLIGVLGQAAKAVCPGKAFVLRFIDLSASMNQLYHFVRLNDGYCQPFASLRHSYFRCLSHMRCGAFVERSWFQLKWVDANKDCHMAAAIWGKEWQGKTVRFQCNNKAVVEILNQGSSQNMEVMHLIISLAFISA